MTQDWSPKTLGEIVRLQRGHDLPKTKQLPGPFPVMGSAGPNGWHSRPKAEGPGIVIGRSGASIGKVHFVEQAYWPHNTGLYVTDFFGNDPRFLSYYLSTLDLAGYNSGSAQPSLNRNFLYGCPVRIPPLPIQKRIAAILSAYDDLIEVNTRRIAILEEMARRIYEAAEVRFHGEMIELPSVAETTYGHPFKSKQFSEEPVGLGVIRIRDVKKHRASAYTEELGKPHHMVQPMDILIGMDGEFHMSIWAGQDAWLNQRVARLRPLKSPGWPVGLLLEAVRKPIQHLNNTIVGTTVAHLSAKDLKTLRVPNFGQPELASLSASLEPAASLLVTLRKQNANLRAQRDLLLPRLVSGKLDLSEIDLPQKDLAHA